MVARSETFHLLSTGEEAGYRKEQEEEPDPAIAPT
jgi:hypothetical protein